MDLSTSVYEIVKRAKVMSNWPLSSMPDFAAVQEVVCKDNYNDSYQHSGSHKKDRNHILSRGKHHPRLPLPQTRFSLLRAIIPLERVFGCRRSSGRVQTVLKTVPRDQILFGLGRRLVLIRIRGRARTWRVRSSSTRVDGIVGRWGLLRNSMVSAWFCVEVVCVRNIRRGGTLVRGSYLRSVGRYRFEEAQNVYFL